LIANKPNGPGALVKVNGIIHFIKYQGILGKYLVAYDRKLGHKWIFQQDNNQRKHIKINKEIVMWPSQSLDLNPIEICGLH
jgi:hypothetical protein